MARRGKTSGAGDFIDVVALLPWWVGVVLAVVSFVLLHWIATGPVGAPTAGSPNSGFFLTVVARGAATGGQFILPIFFLAGAAASAFRRRQREKLLENATAGAAANAIDGMSWQEFEMLVGEGFRRLGYQVVESGGGGADGGVDLVLSRPAANGNEKVLVQCKQWRAFKVGVDVVRELYGVMAARGAAAGIVVTSGRFTAEAEAFAQGRNVALIDGAALEELIRNPQSDSPQRSAEHGTHAVSAYANKPAAAATTAPSCPSCGKPMIQRTASRGASAGSRFWGCSGFPACRGTRPVS